MKENEMTPTPEQIEGYCQRLLKQEKENQQVIDFVEWIKDNYSIEIPDFVLDQYLKK